MTETKTEKRYSNEAASRGEPSYVWRDGQKRRFKMIQSAAGDRIHGLILEDGCGVGSYLCRLAAEAQFAVGIEIEYERTLSASRLENVEKYSTVNSCGEQLPLMSETFDLVLSHEVIEHVQNDRDCICEIVRCLKPGGRLVLFCPNRGYPYETHGIYRNGEYHFGNALFVNYLPRKLRDRLAPHVNVYTKRDLERLFEGLPVRYIQRTIIFGAYDNIIARSGKLGKFLRAFLQGLEKTPLRFFGLSHFWVVEKLES